MQDPEVSDLIRLFSHTFEASHRTILVAGGDEPEYRPADGRHQTCHHIVFAHGFFASALHEIAHWCIAGPERRKLYDYGYWYQPDDRTADQQIEFERVEVRPQAYEWLLAQAAGHGFHYSADNLSGAVSGPSERFRKAVRACVEDTLDRGLPDRLQAACRALSRHYRTDFPACAQAALGAL